MSEINDLRPNELPVAESTGENDGTDPLAPLVRRREAEVTGILGSGWNSSGANPGKVLRRSAALQGSTPRTA